MRGALDAGVEDGERVLHVFRDEEVFGKFKHPPAGLGVDVHVGDQVFIRVVRAQAAYRGIDLIDFGADDRVSLRGRLGM